MHVKYFGHMFPDRGANPHIRNPWGYTPLFMGTDSPEIVQSLLKYDINVDELCGDRGEASIHLACVIGSLESVQMLLQSGSNINVRTFYEETPLWLAAWKGHVDVCRLLLKKNCALNVPSNGCRVYAWDYMPVEIAMGLGHFEIMRMIFRAGCSLTNKLYFNGDYEEQPGPLEEYPWLRLRPEPLEYLRGNKAELAWLKRFVSNPSSLKHACRLVVRRRLGYNLDKTFVEQLHIPRHLMAYLFMGP